ncbi:MAG: DUF3667 domain-containing protein [Bacteroidota bacterium]
MSVQANNEHNHCLNCGNVLSGTFCSNCGQKDIENLDRSILKLIGNFFINTFFLDNRFLVSFKYLLLKPGVMTHEFLEGKRKKFFPPITLFLFINLIYFFFSPLSDYSLKLYDQITLQPHSKLAKKLVDERLNNREVDFKTYSLKYNSTSDNISKSVMILNVPMIAFFVFIICLKTRKFYYDALIFSFHFFSFFLLSVLLGSFLIWLLSQILSLFSYHSSFRFFLHVFVLILPITYAGISFKNYAKLNWIKSLLGGLFIYLGLGLSQGAYRAIIFFLTYYTT